MGRARHQIDRFALLIWTVGLTTVALTLGSSGPVPGAEDLFRSMGVERPAKPGLAPDLALPALGGETVHIKDFRGKVVLLGFFSTT